MSFVDLCKRLVFALLLTLAAAAQSFSQSSPWQVDANGNVTTNKPVAVGTTVLNQKGIAGRNDIVDVLADCGAQGAGAGTHCSSADTSACHDDYAAIAACITAHPGRTILLPHTCFTPSCVDYFSSAQFDVIYGSGTGTMLKGASEASSQRVHFKFASGVGGFKLRAYHSIRDLWLEGSDAFNRADLRTYILPTGFGGSGPAVDGLVLGARSRAINMLVSKFARHCITADAVQTYNADKVLLDHVEADNCRGDGVNTNGHDGQVGTFTNVSAKGNQLYGMRHAAEYGNTWIEPDTQQNHSPYYIANTELSGTISGIVCASGSCTVTMTQNNTLYVDDNVKLSGTSDTNLNKNFFVTGVTGTTFTFASNITETLGAGGTASYNQGHRVWAAAASSCPPNFSRCTRGGSYNIPGGVVIDPYAEGNEPQQFTTFRNNSGSALVLNPQGNLGAMLPANMGATIGMHHWFPTTNGLIDARKGSPVWMRHTDVPIPDGVPAAFSVFQGDPTSPINVPYSRLSFRRSFYGSGNNSAGNASNWWCYMLAGSYNAYLSTSDLCMADSLTDPLRSNLKNKGMAWFPNGLLLGALAGHYTPTMYVGVGTAAPTIGSWAKGDIVINSNPSAGAAWGWRCTAAGTPGTWETLTLVPAGAKERTCEIHINGRGSSGVIQATDGDFVNCVNATGATLAVTSVTCFSDNAGKTTVQLATNAPTNLLTNAVTCSQTGASGTLKGAPTMANGTWLTAPRITADGATKTLVIVIGRTL